MTKGLFGLLLRLKREVRVHPAATERQQYTEPLLQVEDLALAVPANRQNEDGLQVAHDVESERRGSTNDQELREVVHGGHDTRCADRPQQICRYCAEIGNRVEERNEGDQQADRDGCLVQKQLRRRDLEVFDLLADPDLVESGRAERKSRNDDAEERRLDLSAHCEGNADAGGEDSCKHPLCDGLSEDEEVDQNNGRGCHDLGQLVEANRVEGQAEVAKNDVTGKEGANWHHVPDVELDGLEGAERSES